jgi:uroporphyrin-III C-methyltransferase/precorrin-2 dehydrogenase/sirohydrochlorin ferrochelatase
MSIPPSGARAPDTSPPTRLAQLATLPVFYKLLGKRVVLAGGGDPAVWKAELLAATGARLEIFAPEPSDRLVDLVAQCPNARLTRRAWTPADLHDAALAVAEAEDDEAAGSFRATARAAGVPVNVIDKPAFCDFQFGALVERSPLVIGISTDGAAPVFGQDVRARIEALLPDGLRAWAQAAKNWRPQVTSLRLPFRARRQFWEAFTRTAMREPGRTPSQEDLDGLLAAVASDVPADAQQGSVVLVGAGPGDPELLTIKAVRALQSADVVLYDDLVSPETLSSARREAVKINVGKRGYKPSCTQDDISSLLVSLAREGKRVVRLKGGDPMIFGRAGEEIERVREAGIPIEIVPGVTAAAGAAASLGISLTERDVARRVQFITAHARDGKLPNDLGWKALTDPRATTVVYMGVRTLAALSEKLMAEGLAPDTPATLVERATWVDERRISGTIESLPAQAATVSPSGPCLVLIGAALARPPLPVRRA